MFNQPNPAFGAQQTYVMNGGYDQFGRPIQQTQPQVQGNPENYNNQLLSAEQMKELRSHPHNFNSKLTYQNFLLSICTHKDESRNINLETFDEDSEGNNVRCGVCGCKWHLYPENTPIDEIQQVVYRFYSILQTAKAYATNVPEEMKEFLMMVELCKKVPEFWKLSVAQFQRSYNNLAKQQQQQQYQPQGLNQLGMLFGNTGMTFGGFGMGMQTPMGAQPQMGNPAFGQQYQYAQPMNNTAFDQYGRPMATQMPPMAANNQAMPPQYAQPAAPAMPSANPIGFVDNTPDFTQMSTPQQPATTTTQQTVAMPGPSVDAGNQQVPPMPEPPKNPNLVANSADVKVTTPGTAVTFPA